MVSVKVVLMNRVAGNLIQKDHLCSAFTCKFHYYALVIGFPPGGGGGGGPRADVGEYGDFLNKFESKWWGRNRFCGIQDGKKR